jgi:hypothetical protein
MNQILLNRLLFLLFLLKNHQICRETEKDEVNKGEKESKDQRRKADSKIIRSVVSDSGERDRRKTKKRTKSVTVEGRERFRLCKEEEVGGNKRKEKRKKWK